MLCPTHICGRVGDRAVERRLRRQRQLRRQQLLGGRGGAGVCCRCAARLLVRDQHFCLCNQRQAARTEGSSTEPRQPLQPQELC
jgi:hypothetical protein